METKAVEMAVEMNKAEQASENVGGEGGVERSKKVSARSSASRGRASPELIRAALVLAKIS